MYRNYYNWRDPALKYLGTTASNSSRLFFRKLTDSDRQRDFGVRFVERYDRFMTRYPCAEEELLDVQELL